MSIGIYKIENLINGKIYIGQSIHIEKRWQEHCHSSKKSLIGKAIQQYGKENFSFQILEETEDITLLNELETKYIHQFNSLAPNGYNLVYDDNQQHHQFNKYTFETFMEIIEAIKNSELSFQEIASLYELDLSMIYYLNRGDYHTLPDESYPLRKVKVQKVQNVTKKVHYCIDCGCVIAKGSTRCEKCDHLRQRRANRPTREELKNLIRNKPFTQIASFYGVSDNAIRKWCKSENLPSKSSEIKSYSEKEWDKI